MSEDSENLEAHERPFFLVGAVRSGTTMLRLLIGHHPMICQCNEMEYVADAMRQGCDRSLDQYRTFLETHRAYLSSGMTLKDSDDFLEIARGFLEQRRALDGKPIVGATVHHAFSLLPRVWPTARFIFLHRDPRDVARSSVQMGWAGTPWRAADIWIEAQQQLAELKRTVAAEDLLEVRFEQLVEDPEAVLRQICEFLGVPFDDRMFEIDKDTTYRRPSPRAAKSWRQSASQREVQQVEAAVGLEAIEAAGYEPSGFAVVEPDAVQRGLLEVEDLVRRVRFRTRRYGWGLWLSSTLARRLPLPALRKAVQLRVNEIDTQHLK